MTIDNSGGAIIATGLQFAVDGYTVAGGALTLTGAAPAIRVGDGAADGADDTATISAAIAGADGLIKSDLGTLERPGLSSLSGGSTVAAGRLAVEGSLANSADHRRQRRDPWRQWRRRRGERPRPARPWLPGRLLIGAA